MPQTSSFVRSLKASVFASLGEKMKGLTSPPICLHLGDTYALPVESACWTGMDLSSPALYRYSHPHGLPSLLEALRHKLNQRNGLSEVQTDWIQVTCGATQALHCALQTLLQPGQGVMILAPYWPLFGGMSRLQGLDVHEVECTPRLSQGQSLSALLQQAYRPGMAALYFANPNNPDGYVYSASELHEIADFARAHDLWVLSDECYEDYVYAGGEHLSIATLPGMDQRTVSAYSFSKSFAMAGHRLGYAVAVPEVMSLLRRVANHTVYNVSATIQQAGVKMLEGAQQESYCQTWLPRYQEARDQLVDALDCPSPSGGAYCFPNFGSPQAAWDFLERALKSGVVLAPGAAFGDAYASYLRICFTCVEPKVLDQACAVLKSLR